MFLVAVLRVHPWHVRNSSQSDKPAGQIYQPIFVQTGDKLNKKPANHFKIFSFSLCWKMFYPDGSGLLQDTSVHWAAWRVWKWYESHAMAFFPQSPDLSLIKYMWEVLGQHVRQCTPSASLTHFWKTRCCSGSLWWSNTSLREFCLGFPLNVSASCSSLRVRQPKSTISNIIFLLNTV